MGLTTPNMNYFYNIEYFAQLKNESIVRSYEDVKKKDEDEKEKSGGLSFKRQNEYLKEFNFKEASNYVESLEDSLSQEHGFVSFDLWTIYPGLLIGAGNSHDISSKDGITGGFEFDWVSGLPIIPGSSLKGILRSLFPDKTRKRPDEAEHALTELIKVLTEKEDLDVEKLREEIFDNNDIFLGGFPIVTEESGKLLALDYITPHAAYGPTANPVPISILKVKPKVRYRFMFILHEGLLSINEKKGLFEELLKINGAGAKTNVGFGQFVDENQIDTVVEPVIELPEFVRLINRNNNSIREIGSRNNSYGKNKYVKDEELIIGEPYSGEVFGYNKEKTKANGRLKNGTKFSLYFKNVHAKYGKIDQVIPLGPISVKYLGKENGYDQWSVG